MSLQGPHHVAQKSTSTYFSFSCGSTQLFSVDEANLSPSRLRSENLLHFDVCLYGRIQDAGKAS